MKDNRKKCLICKEPMARWFYGMPAYDDVEEGLANNTIILGGCCLSDDNPKWACVVCCISYRHDGIGFLDKGLIDQDYFTKTYQLPTKIQMLLANDFLKTPKTIRSVGFHFHEGGYSSSFEDIRYLDGILIWNQFETQMDFLYNQYKQVQLPTQVFLLSAKMKKKLDTFITTSRWKKDYFQPILDGTQWELERMFQKKHKKSYGSNDFPKVYEELKILLQTASCKSCQ